MKQQGMVYLVGAGPGDYRLISVKGLELLKMADCIIHDRLADARLLDFARPDAERIYVGKAAGNHTLPQDDINALLAGKAAAGKKVVRLKGGDPFVFGRGGEEALYLAEKQIPFEIIPGITAAIAVPAYAGIPVTHRGLASSFAVITGHEDPAKDTAVHWEKLAQGADTLVVVMGVENLPSITAKLMEHGRPGSMPAAIIRWGAKPEQRTIITTLANAAADAAKFAVESPAILISGEVVRLHRDLAWFECKPLFGRTVLVTRSREQASALTAGLEALGAQCLEAPAITIRPPAGFTGLDQAISRLADYQWLIFTSVNGVDYFFDRLFYNGRDSRSLATAHIAAIGSETAARLKKYGIMADLVPVEFRAEGVAEALAGRIAPGMRVLIPRAAAAREILPQMLREAGAVVDVAEAYRTVQGEFETAELKARLESRRIDIITFTSSSTVVNLLAILGEDGAGLVNRATIACIGPVTATACLDNGLRPDIIAAEYTIQGLIDSILEHVSPDREGKEESI